MVAHACNPNAGEMEIGRQILGDRWSVSLDYLASTRPARDTSKTNKQTKNYRCYLRNNMAWLCVYGGGVLSFPWTQTYIP